MLKMVLKCFIITLCLSIAFGAALAKDDHDKKKRVLDKDLSDQDHFDGEDHNLDYDHAAFLGEDEARDFDDLTPEESKEKLAEIVNKIDKDDDGAITHTELKEWIEYTQRRYIIKDVKNQWESHNPKNKDTLPWEEYKAIVYGFLDNIDENEVESSDDGMSYKEMLLRDEKRWKAADIDGDGALNFDEFTSFLHPEDSAHMQDVVVQETMEDIDKNGDGKLSLEEYIGDFYSTEGKTEEEEPEWVASERDHFHTSKDKDKSGFMEINEVKEWILPQEYDHASVEATHLISEADVDKDSVLSKDEILENYDLFVGSQATDFGEALVNHDEF